MECPCYRSKMPTQAIPCSRRSFLTQAAIASTALVSGCATRNSRAVTGKIMTVRGPLDATDLGLTLTHEHTLVDFIGADQISRKRYDPDDAFATVLPRLKQFRKLGGRALIECTPAYIGRDPLLLRRLSVAADVGLVTNTGYYGAVGNKYLPPHAHTETADQLAARWITEWEEGIEGTGIHPGFIKLGVDAGRLSALHEKLILAGARAHRRTGLPLAVHTGDGASALDQLRVLKEEGIDPSAWIWVHAQNDPGPTHLEVAKAGGWVSLDGISQVNLDAYFQAVMKLKQAGLLGRVLISHDDGWSIEGQPPGGNLKPFGNGNDEPYTTVLTRFVPLLKERGFAEAEIRQLLVGNPRQAFRLRPAIG